LVQLTMEDLRWRADELEAELIGGNGNTPGT
jgi:hypothetical protein